MTAKRAVPGDRSRRAQCVVVILAAVLPLLGLVEPAQAIYIRHDRAVGDYNAVGLKTAFASSGYIADTRYGSAFASGTLISSTKVLTAAHVVDSDGDSVIDDPAMIRRLSFGTQKSLPLRLSANVASVAVNPAYKGGVPAFDLAVITLKTPIAGVMPGRLSAASALNRLAALVGYGYQGTGTRDGLTGANGRLGAHNMVSRLTDGTYLTDFDAPRGNKSSFGGTIPLNLEGTTASGDSGSALWADYGNGTWRVAGVLNGGYNEKGRDSWYGDISVYASLTESRNVSFLRGQGLTITSAAATSGTGFAATAGARSAPVPEPGAAALLLPLAGLLARRTRHTVVQ